MTDQTDNQEARMTQASPGQRKAYIVTGPTAGIGYRTALELAKHGTVVLVGRDQGKLSRVRLTIERARQHAVPVVCDNAGTAQARATKNAQGWDTVFATNHLGPFVLTEGLMPHLSDGANVVFVCVRPRASPATRTSSCASL
jgi:NAD(P)-dependent dehydrogenase (short-subunit alcohol dehydrogenase family)